MIEFEEALLIVTRFTTPLGVETTNLDDSLGRVLAADVFSDMDMPPFDKSAVDGYACRREDLGMELKVLETVPAGRIPSKTVGFGQCSKLMTGGMLPEGADTVIMVEDTEEINEGTIRFTGTRTAPNFCPKSEDIKEGEKVLQKGALIRPQEIAVLASVGCWNPSVAMQPVVAVISTGDELVEPNEVPALSQIRNSNAAQLLAQASRAGCRTKYFGIAPDTMEGAKSRIQQAASECDIVLVTGGISAGDFDFVPLVIQQLGFDIKFRSIAVQPGKPVIFAVREGKYLVALPGNPVSSFVQFELLVRHLIRTMTGNSTPELHVRLPIAETYSRRKADRKAFFPVRLTEQGTAISIEYHGSAHIHSYIHADGIATIGIGSAEITKGTLIDVRLV